ncbi:Zn-ribbon domain-containing OB-fold protein [Halomarina salina]|uniref:Zn-ribbon domain-containing OB-fold protein n=1 Tax=Halomarina salina TaxID=1872699 RepID=A0ABD5RSN9_9EURY|nr:Zn-ribbon domain-containing OB-fold protein [Halomarina salina]
MSDGSDDERDGSDEMSDAPETWEPRPLPDVTPESERYWAAASDGVLLLSRCPDCGLVVHYPRARCPDCFAETEWTEASGEGTVYTYSVAERMEGWPEADLPLVVAYVELVEGPRVMTNLVDCDPDDVEVGASVGVEFVPTEREDVSVPVFGLD